MTGLALSASRPAALSTPRLSPAARVWRWVASPDARAVRVTALLGVVLALSLIDLYLTLLFVTHTGMSESNPIARLLLRHGSLASVAAFKLGTVGLSSFILFRARRRGSAEAAAVVCAVAMALLTAHWMAFSHEQLRMAQHPTLAGLDEFLRSDGDWVERTDLLPRHRPGRAPIARVW